MTTRALAVLLFMPLAPGVAGAEEAAAPPPGLVTVERSALPAAAASCARTSADDPLQELSGALRAQAAQACCTINDNRECRLLCLDLSCYGWQTYCYEGQCLCSCNRCIPPL